MSKGLNGAIKLQSVLICLLEGFLIVHSSNILCAKVGDEITITCPSSKVFSWTFLKTDTILAFCNGKNEINMNSYRSSRLHVSSNCTLRISKFEKEDVGMYKCSHPSENINGMRNHIINIQLRSTPVVTNTSQVFSTGDKPRNLKCEVSREQNIFKFNKWRHLVNGQHVRFLDGNNDGTLTLPYINTSDIQYDDSGLYICNVSYGIRNINGQLWQTGTVNVTIRDKPVLATPLKQVYIGHTMSTTSVSLYLFSSSELSVAELNKGNSHVQRTNCSATIVNALFHGTPVNVSGYICNFSITNSKEVYFQNFSAMVSNECCSNMFNFSIWSTSTPEMPRNVQVLTLGVKLIVIWQTGKGDGKLQTFLIEYRKGFDEEWNVILVKDKTSVVIDGLQAETLYTVRVFAMTLLGKSNKTDEIIVKTGSRHFKIHNYIWKISLISSGAVVVFLLCLYGIKVLGKRFCLNRPHNRYNTSQGNETTQGTLGAHYDEIDSVHYDDNGRPDRILSNIPLETLLSSNNRNNIANNAANNDNYDTDNQQEISFYGAEINITGTNNDPTWSSADDLYLVPCQNYINLELGFTREHKDREQEGLADILSMSNSGNSETQIKK